MIYKYPRITVTIRSNSMIKPLHEYNNASYLISGNYLIITIHMEEEKKCRNKIISLDTVHQFDTYE